jgi:hypothetical protein
VKHSFLFTYDDVCFYTKNPTSFTFFRGYDILPADEFNPSIIQPFLDFTFEIICDGNDELYHYLIRWIASILIRPETKQAVKLEVAIIIIGETRTGKTTFVDVLSKLFGRYAVPNITDISHVLGQFNSVFEYKQLVILNEIESVAERGRINYDRLKTVITDKTVSYNKKYGPMGQGDNIAHFIFTTNNMVPVPIPPKDIKFFVTNTSSAHQNDIEFFEELTSTFTPEFYSHLMHFFQNIDISNFQHRHVPSSSAKKLIQKASVDMFEQFTRTHYHMIEDLSAQHLFDMFKKFCTESKIAMKGTTREIFLAEMNKYVKVESVQALGRIIKIYNIHPTYVKKYDDEHIEEFLK